ncbi:hypothetical protein Ssi02_05380 [Sinosporangium siamense]|uniref:Uncharacterized protein n=1 Tax=Sinosporangium siamense TaxID=1367973 RepID=A0A919RAZ3_9ACTN|nr:hypothetical protein Ssi02_05380 [Sinosporangium siamense]
MGRSHRGDRTDTADTDDHLRGVQRDRPLGTATRPHKSDRTDTAENRDLRGHTVGTAGRAVDEDPSCPDRPSRAGRAQGAETGDGQRRRRRRVGGGRDHSEVGGVHGEPPPMLR